MWKVKKIISKGDYQYALVSNHPNATKNGYVLLHRILMENHLGRLLNPTEVIHHINGNKRDNVLSNLKLMHYREHVGLHSRCKLMVELKCPECGEIFTREKRQTHLVKGGKCTCCSRVCSGKFNRKIQLSGFSHKLEKAISENVVREYLDNSEQTV